MGWYSSEWSHRWAVTVANSAGDASGDVEITVPVDWDGWDVIQSDGDDIRVTTADGQTLATYALSGFSYANRTVTIQVDAVTLSGVAGMDLLWVYAGNSNAASGASAVVIAAAKAGYIETGAPSTHLVEAMTEVPGTSRPRRRLQKTADEQVFVWLRLDRLLERKAAAYAGHRQHEEVRSVAVTVSTGGAAQAAMVDSGKQRFLERRGRNGREFWVKAFVKAGSSGTNYTVECDMRTVVPTNSEHRRIEPRSYLYVYNVSEA